MYLAEGTEMTFRTIAMWQTVMNPSFFEQNGCKHSEIRGKTGN
jgi:hypothetical protein